MFRAVILAQAALRAPPEVAIVITYFRFFSLIVIKMTTPTQQKKRERPSLPGGRENYEKLPKNPQPNQTA